MPSINGWQSNNKTNQHLPWSGNVSTLLPPCCQPLSPLAACCLLLSAQRWHWPLPLNAWSVIWLWSVHCPLSKQNKIWYTLFVYIVWIRFLPHQGNNSWQRPTAMAAVMANEDDSCDGQWRWQLWWPMVMEMAMADSKGNGNGDGNGNSNGWQWHNKDKGSSDGRWKPWWQWLTATEMAIGDSIGNGNGDGDGNSNGNCNGNHHAMAIITKGGLLLYVPAMCSALAGATPCLHPPWTQRSVHSPGLHHGGDTAQSVWSLKGGGFLTAHHGSFFYFLQLLFS